MKPFGKALTAIALSAGTATIWAQAGGTPPLKGVSASPLAAFEFERDTPSFVGQTMRMRRITIEPGGSIGEHNHRGRPAVLYVVQGGIVERRGEAQRAYATGESYAIGGDTSHAIENAGSTPAVYIEVDIVPAR